MKKELLDEIIDSVTDSTFSASAALHASLTTFLIGYGEIKDDENALSMIAGACYVCYESIKRKGIADEQIDKWLERMIESLKEEIDDKGSCEIH